MVCYEVNLSVELQIAEEFKLWLHDHVSQIVKIKGFIEAKIWQVESSDSKLELCVKYFLNTRQDLQNYFDHHASQMRQEGLNKFGQQFVAQRRVLTEMN